MPSREPAPTDDPRPRVSAVVPTCNRREILKRCVRSLAEQEHDAYEAIIVDDASTDGTVEMLEQLAREHPGFGLRWHRFDRHAGANAARNAGVRLARAPIVAFFDSDCVLQPDCLRALEAAVDGDDVAGAVGLVEDPPPRNIYELAFRGTHRVAGPGEARRLVACNMAIRRDVLQRYFLDEDRAQPTPDGAPPRELAVSGRGDEEGLHLALKHDGWRVLAAPDARVLHVHHYNRRTFFLQAFRGGRSAARLVYKFRLPPRKDIAPFLLAWASLPLALISPWLLLAPAFFLAVALAAIAYNDVALKGKTAWQTARSFPVLVAYYHVRVLGYALEAVRLRTTRHAIPRAPRRSRAA